MNRQRYEPSQPLKIGDFSDGTQKTVEFLVPIPDSRLYTKLGIVFSNAWYVVGTHDYTNMGGSYFQLWLAGWESNAKLGRNNSPVGGGYAVTNIFGTRSAPRTIPEESGLQGFSLEYPGTTGVDAIYGRLTMVGTTQLIAGSQVSLFLKTLWQPAAGICFCPEEWQEITGQCVPQMLTPVPTVGAGSYA